MFVGYGPDTYIYVYPITVPIQERIVISANAHNMFLNILIENGAIGFISIIFLILAILNKLRYKFMNSDNSLKFIAISFGVIIISRLIEQTLGVAVINDLLYFYLLVSLVALFTKQKGERKINLNVKLFFFFQDGIWDSKVYIQDLIFHYQIVKKLNYH